MRQYAALAVVGILIVAASAGATYGVIEWRQKESSACEAATWMWFDEFGRRYDINFTGSRDASEGITWERAKRSLEETRSVFC